MKKLLTKTIFIIECVICTLLFITSPIFWWLFITADKKKTQEELIEDTRNILNKYINDIKLFLGLNEIPEIVSKEYNSMTCNIAGFEYKRRGTLMSILNNWADDVLNFTHSEPILLMEGINNELGYNISIQICTKKIYSLGLVFNNLLIYRFYLIHILVHELTHYIQFKREELQNIEYITAVANISLYKKQPVEKEANRIARGYVMKNFIKILLNK